MYIFPHAWCRGQMISRNMTGASLPRCRNTYEEA